MAGEGACLANGLVFHSDLPTIISVLVGSKEMHPRKNHAASAHESIELEFHSFVGASWYYDYNIEQMFLSRGYAANQRDFIVLTCGVRLIEAVK